MSAGEWRIDCNRKEVGKEDIRIERERRIVTVPSPLETCFIRMVVKYSREKHFVVFVTASLAFLRLFLVQGKKGKRVSVSCLS